MQALKARDDRDLARLEALDEPRSVDGGDAGRAMDVVGGEKFDVIVVGAGNAATCAALSAREGGARRSRS